MANATFDCLSQINTIHIKNHMMLLHHITEHSYCVVWNDGLSWFIHKDICGDLHRLCAGPIDSPWPSLRKTFHMRSTLFISKITWCCCITSQSIHIVFFEKMDCLGLYTKTSLVTCIDCVLGKLTHHPTLHGIVHIRSRLFMSKSIGAVASHQRAFILDCLL